MEYATHRSFVFHRIEGQAREKDIAGGQSTCPALNGTSGRSPGARKDSVTVHRYDGMRCAIMSIIIFIISMCFIIIL